MLSICPLGRDSTAYYLHLQGEHTGYYTKESVSGHWLGSGAKALGLTRTVENTAFERIFRGWHPTENKALVRNPASECRRPGWDGTFSAPKSVSILVTLSDIQTQRAVSEAHWEAVRYTIQHLEDNIAYSRMGTGGREKTRAGLFVAAFEHMTSRNLDPSLHIHCCLLNVSLRPDGSTGAVHSKPFYDYKMVAGVLYRVELALQLEQRLGLEIEWNGTLFEIKGVPNDLIQAFSTRRQAIVEALQRKGYTSAYAAAVTTLETRPAKRDISHAELTSQWEATGRTYRFTEEDAERLLHRYQPTRSLEQERSEQMAYAMQALALETEARRLVQQERYHRLEHRHSLMQKAPEQEHIFA